MNNSPLSVLFGKGHLPLSLPAAARATIIRKAALPKLPVIPAGPYVVPFCTAAEAQE